MSRPNKFWSDNPLPKEGDFRYEFLATPKGQLMAQLQSLKSFLMANFPDSPDLLEIARLEIELEEVDRRDMRRCIPILRGELFKKWHPYYDKGITASCSDCYALENFSESEEELYWWDESDWENWQKRNCSGNEGDDDDDLDLDHILW